MTKVNDSSQELEHCPLCGNNLYNNFRFGLVQCQTCEVIVSPLVWRSDANEMFGHEWFGHKNQSRTSFWVDLFEVWKNANTLGRLKRAKLHGNRLLEIGVGSGSFLNAARRSGYRVEGCDLSQPVCRHVEQEYGITVHNAKLSDLANEGEFDVVVINHVLEHVHQPVDFLRDVCRLLVPGGVAHVAVPNIACWEAVLPGWTSYEPYHLWYFSPQSLEKTISDSGLAIHSVVTCESFSDWFLTLLRTALGINSSEGALTSPAASGNSRLARRRSVLVEHVYRVTMVATGIFLWPMRWFQGLVGRGSELICIVSKPLSRPEDREGALNV